MTNTESPESASTSLRLLVRGRAARAALAREHAAFLQHDASVQARAIDAHLSGSVRTLIETGWSPDDLYELARRTVNDALLEHLLGAIAAETARHDPATVDPRWSAQLRGTPPAGGCFTWAMRRRLDWPKACNSLIDLLAALEWRPPLRPLLPRPGEWRGDDSAAPGVNERILRKVRALLAKAESTEFDGEADALSAKAQELMSTYSIERAVAEAEAPTGPTPLARRIWLDSPYADAKWLLVSAVAESNRCRCVYSKSLGVATLIGFSVDLDAVELLSTSLLVQAARAMQAAGRQPTYFGTSRTRSFRQSFLVSFAHRIGERLRTVASATESAADTARSGALVPVLAARELQVSAAVVAYFPKLRERSVTASDAAGWGAGRAAADRASLSGTRAIGRAG